MKIMEHYFRMKGRYAEEVKWGVKLQRRGKKIMKYSRKM